MLEDLAKKDKKWRRIAYSFCNDKSVADDIVQDMYLKVSNYDKKVNDSYIYFVLKSIFIDYVRKNKNTIPINLIYNLKCNQKIFEANDKEIEILNRFNKLNWKQKELIEESYYSSLRDIEKKFPLINYGYAYRQIHKGLKKVLLEDYNKYNNSHIKYKKNG